MAHLQTVLSMLLQTSQNRRNCTSSQLCRVPATRTPTLPTSKRTYVQLISHSKYSPCRQQQLAMKQFPRHLRDNEVKRGILLKTETSLGSHRHAHLQPEYKSSLIMGDSLHLGLSSLHLGLVMPSQTLFWFAVCKLKWQTCAANGTSRLCPVEVAVILNVM